MRHEDQTVSIHHIDGHAVMVVGETDKRVKLFDMATGEERQVTKARFRKEAVIRGRLLDPLAGQPTVYRQQRERRKRAY